MLTGWIPALTVYLILLGIVIFQADGAMTRQRVSRDQPDRALLLMVLTIPHAFNWPEGLATGDWQSVQQVLTYFSFTTLTTVGFGDVTPAIPLTRTLAIFEAMAGQLYLVVTLTRLVSLSVTCPASPRKPD